MTYILGARCKDGIVLVGDRRVTRGSSSYQYEDKIFSDVRYVVIGASGVIGLFDKFRRQISEVARPDIKVADFIREAEKIVYTLNKEYLERTTGTVELLVAYGKIRKGELQYITPTGLGEVVRRYHAIGSGEPYGAYLLRKLWKDDLTMKQAAVLGSVIVKHIEENELDPGVGVGGDSGPQIWLVPDWPLEDAEYNKLSDPEKKNLETREIGRSEQDEIQKRVGEMYPKIEESLKDFIL